MLDELRKPFFIIALVLMLFVVLIEMGSAMWVDFGTKHTQQLAAALNVDTPGYGIVYLAFLDGLVFAAIVEGGVAVLEEILEPAVDLVGIEAELSWERDIPPDPEALADAVCRVQRDLATFAAGARARAVERFDVGSWIARHRRVLEGLVA